MNITTVEQISNAEKLIIMRNDLSNAIRPDGYLLLHELEFFHFWENHFTKDIDVGRVLNARLKKCQKMSEALMKNRIKVLITEIDELLFEMGITIDE